MQVTDEAVQLLAVQGSGDVVGVLQVAKLGAKESLERGTGTCFQDFAVLVVIPCGRVGHHSPALCCERGEETKNVIAQRDRGRQTDDLVARPQALLQISDRNVLERDIGVDQSSADADAGLHRVVTEVVTATERDSGPHGVVVPIQQDSHQRLFVRLPQLLAITIGRLRNLSRSNGPWRRFPLAVEQGVFATLPTGFPIVPGPKSGTFEACGEVRQE